MKHPRISFPKWLCGEKRGFLSIHDTTSTSTEAFRFKFTEALLERILARVDMKNVVGFGMTLCTDYMGLYYTG